MDPPSLRRSIPGGDLVSMAADGVRPNVAPSSDYTPTVEYSIRYIDDGAPSDPYNYGINAVVNARSQFPVRPGRSPDTRRRDNRLMPVVCFICYIVGHLSTECRHASRVCNDADFVNWQCENFHKLAKWQQEWLKHIERVPGPVKPPARSVDPPKAQPEDAVLMTKAKNRRDESARPVYATNMHTMDRSWMSNFASAITPDKEPRSFSTEPAIFRQGRTSYFERRRQFV